GASRRQAVWSVPGSCITSLAVQKYFPLLAPRTHSDWSRAVHSVVLGTRLDVTQTELPKFQSHTCAVLESLGRNLRRLSQSENPLHPTQVAQRVIAMHELVDHLLRLRPDALGFPQRHADIKAGQAQLFFRIVPLVRRKLTRSSEAPMHSERLMIAAKYLNQSRCFSHSHHASHSQKWHRIEVFLHLHMTVRMHFARAPLRDFKARLRHRMETGFLSEESFRPTLPVILHDALIEFVQVDPEFSVELCE